MLAKGEVEEIIVRPDIEIVTIILYDGAVVKGKKVINNILFIHILCLLCRTLQIGTVKSISQVI